MKLHTLLFILSTVCLVSCASLNTLSAPDGNATPLDVNHIEAWQGNSALIWEKLQYTSKSNLISARANLHDAVKVAWIELALISKQDSTHTAQLVADLKTWRTQNPSHPGNELFPNNASLDQLLNQARPKHLALLIPLQGVHGASGKAVREGFLNAYYAHLAENGQQSIAFYDTTQTQNIATLYQKALSEGADFVIGPLEKTQVQQLAAAGSINALTLALNYTEVGFFALPSNFYEFGLLPEDEVKQIVNHARRAHLNKALVIAPQNQWGSRMVNAFDGEWQGSGGKVIESWYYHSSENLTAGVAHLLRVDPTRDKKLAKNKNNKYQLSNQRRQDFDVIFIFAQPKEAGLIIPLLRYYYASNIPIYASANIDAAKLSGSSNIDFNGVTVCSLPGGGGEGSHGNRLYAVGQDAYALSQQLPRLMQMPYFPIYGTTGALTLSAQHQIHRRLPCTEIRNH